MKTAIKLLCLLPLLLAVRAVAQMPSFCVIQDWGACTSGSAPTNACALGSTYGETPTTNNFNSTADLTISTTAHQNPWLVTPTCASGWPNTSANGMVLTIPSGSPNNTLTQLFSSSTGPTIGSAAVAWETNVPQSAPTGIQYYDTFDISLNGGFVNFQWLDSFSPGNLDWDFECGGCTQNAASNRLLPSNTWWTIEEFANGTTNRYIGMWNASTGAFITGSLATGTSPTAQVINGYYVGAGVGQGLPIGDTESFGPVIECGVTTRETGCPMPLSPGYQRLPPTISLAGGSYSTPQSGITLSDIDGLGKIYYTLDGSTPTCTLGTADVIVSCTGTLYLGSLPTLYITTKVNAIDCLSNYQCSTVTTATYKITAGAGVLAATRAIDWTNVGAVPGQPGTLPDTIWTQSGSTIAACGSSGTPVSPTACGLVAALASCTGGQYVLLAGTTSAPADFYLNSTWSIPSNCELRGGGPTASRIHVSGTGGCLAGGYYACLQGSNNFANGEQNHATWTAGFAQGATSLTFSDTLNMAAGTLLAIDQQDETADTGGVWNCLTTPCGATGSGGGARTDNTCSSAVSPNNGHCSQQQWVKVVSCSPCNSATAGTVVISPGLAMPNWASAKSTGAWWPTTTLQNAGIRDLTIDMSASTANGGPIIIWDCIGCFVYQVETILGSRNHIGVRFSKNVTVQSNYMYSDSVTGTSSYAVEVFDDSDVLVTNNICQQVVECAVQTGGGSGGVFAYNFPVSSDSSSTAFMTQMDFFHASGDSFSLAEGEIVSGVEEDNTHGTHHFFTHARNVLEGWAPPSSCNGTACTVNTVADFILGGSRYGNVIGNLVGQSGYHTVSGTLYYASIAGTQCGNPTWKTIFMVGCGTASATFLSDPTNTGSSTVVFDPLTINSLMLYNNYDVITGTACTATSGGCTASKASAFNDITGSPSVNVGLASPGTMPPSFVFAAPPTWHQNAGASIPWPPIGPDVTGGNLLLCTSGTYNGSYVTTGSQCNGGTSTSAYAGHANANAAMACYLNTMAGAPDGSGSVLSFDPATCYASASSGATGTFSASGPFVSSGGAIIN